MEPRQGLVVASLVVGHGGPHQCSGELSGASRFGCADIPSFRVQSGTGLERELAVGPGGAWCVSGHSQVGSNSYLGLARLVGEGLTSFDELAPWLCPNPHAASASTRMCPSRRP